MDRGYLKEVEAFMELDIHPSRSGNIAQGVKEHLNGMLMRYNEEHGGVILSYSKVVVHGRRAPLLGGLNPYLHARVSARLLLFSPQLGAFLEGVVNNVGEDFVALLVLGVFSVTVPEASMRSFKYIAEDVLGGGSAAWCQVDKPSHVISIGSTIRVVVESVRPAGDLLDVRASLDHAGTGCVAAPKARKKKAAAGPVAGDGAAGPPEPGQPPAQATKKKKRKKSAREDVLGTHQTASVEVVVPGRADASPAGGLQLQGERQGTGSKQEPGVQPASAKKPQKIAGEQEGKERLGTSADGTAADTVEGKKGKEKKKKKDKGTGDRGGHSSPDAARPHSLPSATEVSAQGKTAGVGETSAATQQGRAEAEGNPASDALASSAVEKKRKKKRKTGDAQVGAVFREEAATGSPAVVVQQPEVQIRRPADEDEKPEKKKLELDTATTQLARKKQKETLRVQSSQAGNDHVVQMNGHVQPSTLASILKPEKAKKN